MLLNHVNSLKEKVNLLLNKLDELEAVHDSLKTKNDYLINLNKELENKIAQEVIIISAEIESQIASLNADEQKEYINSIGLEESGLNKVIKNALRHHLVQYILFLHFLTSPFLLLLILLRIQYSLYMQ